MTTRVDLWHVRTDSLDAETAAACARLLTTDEAQQHVRFVFEKNRREYLVTRGLARAVLSTYLAKKPGELSFFRTHHGRPVLEQAAGVTFSLSNTVELVACGVTHGAELGVDAEPLARADNVLGVVERVFTDGERAELDRLDDAGRRRRAVQLWTLKEAYIKARGLGFSLDVQNIEVVFDVDGTPRMRFFDSVEDSEDRWAFSTFEVEGHLISTCIEIGHHRRSASARPFSVSVRPADLGTLLRSARPA